MDPLSAVGLASNILAFVDFSLKIARAANEIYESKVGLPADLQDADAVAQSFDSYAEKLTAPLVDLAASETDRELAKLASKCKSMCNELRILIENIQCIAPRSRFGSLRIAWSAKRKTPDIQEKLKRLGEYRTQIMALQVTTIAEKVSSLEDGAKSLASGLKTHALDLKEMFQEIDQKTAAISGNSTDSRRSLYEEILQALLTASAKIDNMHIEKKILQVLWFSGMKTRFENIQEAHKGTYRWLLHDVANESELYSDEDDSLQKRKRQMDNGKRRKWREHLRNWLSDGENCFWISGKPGSGKSTLMKSIGEDPVCHELLRAWAAKDRKELLFAQFFFWISGDNLLQKSTYGLHRSMLWQILQARPDLTKQILPTLWVKASKDSIHESDIEPSIIKTAFEEVIGNPELLSKHKVCFFIDGLDEFEGDHWKLSEYLKLCCHTSNVKMCVSSRPYNDFLHAFRPEDGSYLSLQELSEEDILRYVTAELERSEHFIRGRETYEAFKYLPKMVVSRADGVFLWVRLVISLLLSGIRNSFSFKQLSDRLDDIPTELNQMFRHMLKSIESRNWREKQAISRTFLLLKIGSHQSPLDTPQSWLYIHWVMDNISDNQEYEKYILDGKLGNTMGVEKCFGVCTSMRARITERCRGLVQVAATSDAFPACHQLSFVHRTFSDFLDQQELKDNLWKDAGDFIPERAVALGLVDALKHIPHVKRGDSWQIDTKDYGHMERLAQHTGHWQERRGEILRPKSDLYHSFLLLNAAAAVERAGHKPLTAEISSWGRIVHELASDDEEINFVGGGHYGSGILWQWAAAKSDNHNCAMPCLAVAQGALKFAANSIANQDCDPMHMGQMLLVSSLVKTFRGDLLDDTLAFNRFLLDHNASPNVEFHSGYNFDLFIALEDTGIPLSSPPWTPWTLFLWSVSQSQRFDHKFEGWQPHLQLFLDNGSDPSVCFVGYKVDKVSGEIAESGDYNEVYETGPYYMDLESMFDLWELDSQHPSRRWLGSTQHRLGFLGLLRSFNGSRAAPPAPGGIQKISPSDVKRTHFIVLKVAPFRKIEEMCTPGFKEWSQKLPRTHRIPARGRTWEGFELLLSMSS